MIGLVLHLPTPPGALRPRHAAQRLAVPGLDLAIVGEPRPHPTCAAVPRIPDFA
ncbi:hypothetical protein [Streptomyces sp. LMG1-1-1.1]|uniref:hypothetical protein n=1 Tax=Streptomyces sp. LMG1-1-1.1 TaxID=3135245 RepID=UPI003465B95F